MFDLAAHQAAEVTRKRHRRRHPRHAQDRPHHCVAAQAAPGVHAKRRRRRSAPSPRTSTQCRVPESGWGRCGHPSSATPAPRPLRRRAFPGISAATQPAPAADWFVRVSHFQAGRRPAKSATLSLHRPVPPLGYPLSVVTQRYQMSSSGRCASFSMPTYFFGFSFAG